MAVLTVTAPNANEAGIFFLNAAGQQLFPVMLAVGPITLTEGQKLKVDAACVISSRPSSSQNYPGYTKAAAFTASQIFLWNKDPAQNFLYDWTGVPMWPNTAEDIMPGNQPGCYAEHKHDFEYVCAAADADGNPRWVVLVAWCSSDPATDQDWLLWEPSEGELEVDTGP